MTITVYGLPAPQGSKSFKGIHGGKAILAESSRAVKPWREAVRWTIVAHRSEIMRLRGVAATVVNGPVEVGIVFTLPKPKSAPKTRRTWPDRKPDIDKLCRSTLDALVASGVIEDDSRIVNLSALKVYPNEGLGALDAPGAVIRISEATA